MWRCKEQQRQGGSPSLWYCDTALSSAKGSKEQFVWHSRHCDSSAEAGWEDTMKWEEFSSDNESAPLCTVLLKFFDLQARCLESVSHAAHKYASGFDRMMHSVRSYFAVSSDGACLACKKQGLQIHIYSVFKGWTLSYRISVVWEQAFCMNCLRKGHCKLFE